MKTKGLLKMKTMKYYKIWVIVFTMVLSGNTLSNLMFGVGPDIDTFDERMLWLFSYVFSSLVISSVIYFLMKKGILKWNKE